MKPVVLTLLLLAGADGAIRADEVAASPAINEPTVVTSDHMQADYAHNFGTFEGNVVVVDPRLTVRSDKLIVYFGDTNNIANGVTNVVRSLQRMVAIGGVVITQDKKKATSEHADYTAADDKVVLTGNPRVEGPDGIVTGRKITLWHGQEKMSVEADNTDTNRTRLIIFPEEQRKQNAAPEGQ